MTGGTTTVGIEVRADGTQEAARDLAAVDDFNFVAGITRVDLLDCHVDGVLCALAIDSGSAGHGTDNADANDVILTAVRHRCVGIGGSSFT